MKAGSLYQNIPTDLPAEISACLLQSPSVRIERIVSRGHRSATDFWYDQSENEWVLVLQGEAELRFKEDNATVRLAAGMYLNIPAHMQHRVEWTVEDQETIWLAVFY